MLASQRQADVLVVGVVSIGGAANVAAKFWLISIFANQKAEIAFELAFLRVDVRHFFDLDADKITGFWKVD